MSVSAQPRVAGFPLSPQQRRVWELQKADERRSFRVQGLLSIEGPLDVARLEGALRRLVQRHEICRTTFAGRSGSGAPVQLIGTPVGAAVRRVELSGLPPAVEAERIEALFRTGRQEALDLEAGPLLRLTLIERSAEAHRLLVEWPALCADRASLARFVVALARAYEESGRPSSSAPAGAAEAGEPRQYADIAAWANDVLEAEEGEVGRAFWRNRAVPDVASLKLPYASAAPTARFETVPVAVPIRAEDSERIEALAAEQGTSPAVVLLTCFHLLLGRLMGRSDVVVAIACDGRKYEELEHALGPLTRYLPVPGQFSGSEAFTEVLARVHESVEEVRKWQEFFTWDLLAGAGTNEADGRFFPFAFEFEEQSPAVQAGGVSFGLGRVDSVTERFQVRLSCLRRADGLHAELHYDAAQCGPDDVHRLAGQLQTLLRAALDGPRARVGGLDVLSEPERRRLLVDFNDTAAEYPADKCIHELIEEQVRRVPQGTAVSFEGQALTYAELDAQARRLARRLRRLGVGPDVRVALCVPRSLEMVVAILGILQAGGAYVPLDPGNPPERLAFMLEETGAPVLLTLQRTAGSLPPHQARVVYLDTGVEDVEPTINKDEEHAARAAAPVTPANLAYVIYTSGSTGRPKGVMVSHQGLVISNSARISYFKEPVERFLLLSPLAFDSSVVGIFWTLCQGGTLVLVREETQQVLAQLTETIARQSISHLLTLPSFYALILEQAAPGQLAGLRMAIVAGEPCPKRLVDRHRELLPETALFSEYGATETTVWASVYDCRAQTLPVAPIGRPIDNAELYVLDPRLRPTPIGVPGEVHFGGVGLALGYLERPELTAERFVPDPFSGRPGARLYCSGDLARHLADGDVEFLGRIDNQVKVRGYRIELEEIEGALSQHPSVAAAVVLARDDEASTGKRLVAYLVAERSAAPSLKELRAFLKERLPEFMVPSAFVFLQALPRTPNGKVDRRALPAPGPARPELDEAFAGPRTPVEAALAEIWAGVLGLERVGIHDNFFELGGDSILIIQAIARASQAGLQLSPRQLFQHQSVAELAAVAGTTGVRSAEQGLVTGEVPLTPVQHWFFELDLPSPDHSNMPLLLEAPRVDPAALETALGSLLVHHDALRLRCSRQGSEWRQTIVGPAAAVPFSTVDLSSMAEAGWRAALEAEAGRVQASLDLADGPIVRAVWFDLGPDRPGRLLLVVHHLAVDGVSWRILLEDFQTAVRQVLRGEPIRLPAKTSSFKEWAGRLQEHARSAAVREELPYWLSQDPAGADVLPLDNPGGDNTQASARKVTVTFTPEETRALLQEVPKAYRTQVNDVFLTALVQAFSRWTGRPSLLVNLEGHGREEVLEGLDVSRTVGWFTTDFPVRLELDERSDPGEALQAVKEQLRRVANHGIAYGLLRYLSGERAVAERLSGLPKPEVAFNYLGQFDQVLSGGSFFRLAGESIGPSQDGRGRRPFSLEIFGLVADGRLSLDWEYSSNLHHRSTVESLARDFTAALRSLIDHCLSPGAGAFAAADFGQFNWSQQDFDDIAAVISKSQGGA